MLPKHITRTDLEWWWDFAAAREWTFAKTYATSAPHHYIVQDRTPGVTHGEMVRASRVIHTFGVPGKYYGQTKIYLTSPDGQLRWWTEDASLEGTTLVNQASTDRQYGIQNAPDTVSGIDSPYDSLATTWDAEHPAQDGEAERVRAFLAAYRGKFPPHVLDLGCGTGRVLDLGLVGAETYAGLDVSQGMLNMLVRKHPRVAAVYPMDAREAIERGLFTPGQFDWVFLDDAIPLSAEQSDRVRTFARRALTLVCSADWSVTPAYGEPANESS